MDPDLIRLQRQPHCSRIKRLRYIDYALLILVIRLILRNAEPVALLRVILPSRVSTNREVKLELSQVTSGYCALA